jgi:EmrB/QacA subfamily drug resistance transporter
MNPRIPAEPQRCTKVDSPQAAYAGGDYIDTARDAGRRTGLIVVVLALAVFMSSLDLFIVNLALPYISHEFAGTLSSLSWVLNAYTVVFAAVMVPAGRWSDRIGRRKVFVAGLAAFILGSLLCALAPSMAALIGARVIQAVGAGMMVPASLSLLLASVAESRRTAAISMWSAFGAMGAALGPVVGGSLVQASWRWVFWINIPVGLAAIAATLRALPESKDDRATRRPDLAGALALVGCVGLVVYALVKAPAWGWGSLTFIGTLVGAAACGIGLVIRSRTHPQPVIELGLLRSRTFSGAFAASMLFYAGFGAFILNFVEFLTAVWHYSAIQAGLAIAPGPLMVLPFARLVAPLSARFGPGKVAVLGCSVLAAAVALWSLRIQATPAYVTHFLPEQLLGGAGVGLAIPALLGAGSSSLPPARFGTGSGILNTARQVGVALGVASLVAILSSQGSVEPIPTYRHGLTLIIGLLVAAAVVAAGLLTAARPDAATAAGSGTEAAGSTAQSTGQQSAV